jgi:hypothetical protein
MGLAFGRGSLAYADQTVLRRYLAQTEVDLQQTHMKAVPVDRPL